MTSESLGSSSTSRTFACSIALLLGAGAHAYPAKEQDQYHRSRRTAHAAKRPFSMGPPETVCPCGWDGNTPCPQHSCVIRLQEMRTIPPKCVDPQARADRAAIVLEAFILGYLCIMLPSIIPNVHKKSLWA